MKKVYCAFKIGKNGMPVLYKDHPLFAGEESHDLPVVLAGNQNDRQEIEMLWSDTNEVREFVNPAECMQAVIDYNRAHSKKGDAKAFEPFVLLEIFETPKA